MPAFTATAPGKIILFGEHAVVYGRPAIAAPVFQVEARAVVRADPRSAPGTVHLRAAEISLDADLEKLPESQPLAAAVHGALMALKITRPPACSIRVTSTIPRAAGLGSGAAVTVAVLRAFSAFLGRPFPDEIVCSLAFEVEKLHHGTPSGIDNTVITYRRPVYFVRGEPIETFLIPQPFTIVIADTGIKGPTAVAVGELRRAWQKDPARFEPLFERTGEIARLARRAIETGDMVSLGPLMNENHALLVEMGVNSPELEQLVHAARQAGAPGAKLSGAGRGGNMIALAPEGAAQAIADALEKAGAKGTIVTKIKTSSSP
jgi:mevalonate kinase